MLNRLCYQGRLTADPELKQTQSGTNLCSFTVAWSDKYKDNENTCFLRCTAWGKTAEFIEKYFKKGEQILIEGKLKTDTWENEKGKQSRTQCVVDKVHFCGSKKESNTYSETEMTPLDDMPF